MSDAYEECERVLASMIEDAIIRFKPTPQDNNVDWWRGHRFDFGDIIVLTDEGNYSRLYVKGRWSSWKTHIFRTPIPVGEAVVEAIKNQEAEAINALDAKRLQAVREISAAFKKAIDKLEKKRPAE